jgi:translocation and assembly module TamA
VVKVTPGRTVFVHRRIPRSIWHRCSRRARRPARRSPARHLTGRANGQAGRAADILGAEGRVDRGKCSKRGYADVAGEPREVIVDHADHSVRPTFRIVSPATWCKPGRHRGDHARGAATRPGCCRLAPWKSGEVYDPEDVAELERRLLRHLVSMTAISVALSPKEKIDGQTGCAR